MDAASAVIYVGVEGPGRRELGLARIAGKPMVEHVLNAVPDDVEELMVLVGGGGDLEAYSEVADRHLAQVLEFRGGAGDRGLVEFAVENVNGDRLLILPGNAPLITRDFAAFLLECSKKFRAVLPRSPARNAVYSMAAYQTRPIKEVLESDPSIGMDEVVKRVGRVIYLSSMSLRIFDERLGMFFRVSSPQDLKKAEKILKMRKPKHMIEL